MFHIVEFLATQEVEVVPAVWVQNETCQWPEHYKSDELHKATRSTYKTARLKLPQAEIHTDLQTAEEEDEPKSLKKKRKRVPNTRFESDSDEEVTVKQRTLPPAPKIKGLDVDLRSIIKKRMTSPQLRRSLTNPDPRQSVTSPEPRCSLVSPDLEWSETSLESRQSEINPEPSWCVASSEPQWQDESQSTTSSLVRTSHDTRNKQIQRHAENRDSSGLKRGKNQMGNRYE
ncbi:hypothetical protein E1301_Tti022179 [Triplophysa tibetana]|uniref:Uncharacterized protein n=1 Tax=Triplophysa tibetana TaxID=1572043 RepID=A0A5A9PJE4_9TELE|nr:hypothetical protein E1301_Tti022179 [Triplophysa tibetana]